MSDQINSVTVGIEQLNNKIFVKLSVIGKVTHDNYAAVIPLMETALDNDDVPTKLVLVDILNMDGYEVKAALDDLKFWHNVHFHVDKVAIVTSKKWLSEATKIYDKLSKIKFKVFEDGVMHQIGCWARYLSIFINMGLKIMI